MPQGSPASGGNGAVVRLDHVPVSDYSEEFHKLEVERIWPRTWQVACREQELREVGDYVNYEIGNESILVVRSAPDKIRAFYNVCPHRGRRLRDDERGNHGMIFCGYHAWTFDLDGKPTTIPGREDWQNCPAFDDKDLALQRVACDTWGGWVWINMDPECQTLLEYLGPIDDRLGRYEWEHARIRSHQTIIFPVNWKVAIEAFVEPYHVVATHPQLLRWGHGKATPTEEYLKPEFIHAGHYGGRRYEFNEEAEFQDVREYLYTSAYNTYHTLHGLYHEEGLRAAERVRDEGPEGMTLQEASALLSKFRREEIIAKGAKYPEGVTPHDSSIIEWLLFPNSSVLTTVEGAFWYRARPNGDDPNSCIFQIIVLGRYAPGKEPDFEYEFYPTLESFKGRNPILEQDFSNLVAVQKGLKSRAFKAARPNPAQESQVGNFHRVLHKYVYGNDDFARP